MIVYSLFDEAEEAFGAPAEPLRYEAMFAMLSQARSQVDQLKFLANCVKEADELQRQAYSELIGPALDVSGELEQVKDLFHKAARFGEYRMLTRVMAIFHAAALKSADPEGVS